MSRENSDQIPTDSNLEQTEEVLKRQSRIQGMERDDLLVRDFPKAAALAEILKGLSFPTDKKRIVEFVNAQFPDNTRITQAETLELLDKVFDNRQYYNAAEVIEAARLTDSSTV